MDKNEKLILKVQKNYTPAVVHLNVTADIAERVRSIAKDVNKRNSNNCLRIVRVRP